MRFITIFKSKPSANAGPPPSAEQMAQHRATMQAGIEQAAAAGRLIATGSLGMRAKTGGRIHNTGGKVSVETPPEGVGGWMAANGVAIVAADSPEALVAQLQDQIRHMGEGTLEFCAFNQVHPDPTIPQHSESAATVPLPGVIPYFSVEGAKKAAEFYAKAFGAKVVRQVPAEDGKRLMHCQMVLNGGTFMFSDSFPEYGHPAKTDGTYAMQLVVADGHEWWDRAIAAGCVELDAYRQAFWGDMYGRMRDPFGIAWAITSPQSS
jgi:PhnB protein